MPLSINLKKNSVTLYIGYNVISKIYIWTSKGQTQTRNMESCSNEKSGLTCCVQGDFRRTDFLLENGAHQVYVYSSALEDAVRWESTSPKSSLNHQR